MPAENAAMPDFYRIESDSPVFTRAMASLWTAAAIESVGLKRSVTITERENHVIFMDDKSRQHWNLQKPVPFSAILDVAQTIHKMGAVADFETQRQAFLLGADYWIDPQEKILSYQKSQIKADLTDKEIALLRYLIVDCGGAEISRAAVLRHVWGYQADIETHTLETHIYRLRQKLEEATGRAWIKTENGGYSICNKTQ